jgi:hypothetical protein
VNQTLGFVKKGYRDLILGLKEPKTKNRFITIVLIGGSSGLLLGAFITDYKLKAYVATLMIVVGIWHQMSTGYRFKFFKALMNDIKAKFNLKQVTQKFEQQLLLAFNVGMVISPIFSFISKSFFMRAIPSVILLIIALIFMRKNKEALNED